jgi:ribonucleoside-diphosphate reductase alpha chain
MVNGLPYDSYEGNQMAGALTAILTGHGYLTSAEIASNKAPFPGYEKNREPMIGVMKMHQAAAYKLKSKFKNLVQAAQEDWDLAVAAGEKYGYRNAQMTVLAPTGTIGLLMDCDTTGVEPDFSLVKFKKLAGGGYFKIINQSVPAALKNLGYTESQIRDIIHYVTGTQTFVGNPFISTETLMAKGLSASSISEIESKLIGAFDLRSAFSAFSLGEKAMAELKISMDEATKPGFDMLKCLGFSDQDIRQASEIICGTMMIEGAPHLKEEHYAVFDCANKCGNGKRFIAPMGHVRMMAAAQPFLSGAISKTVNLPNETTVEEIEEIYTEGWKLGLKAIAVYRDGCKASQPLTSKSSDSESKDEEEKAESKAAAAAPALGSVPFRRKLPQRRSGFTVEARVGGHKVYLRTGEYPDGSIGEVFIDMHKEGAAFRSLMNCFAISVSIGLQHGVPLETYVNKFVFTRFEPQGPVTHPNVKYSTSVIDYIFRVLGMEYLGRTDFVQVKPTSTKTPVKSMKPEEIVEVTGSHAIDEIPMMESEEPANEADTAVLAVGGGAEAHLKGMMGDAPFCDQCGHTTVRNGACYKCLNCGNSLGCS